MKHFRSRRRIRSNLENLDHASLDEQIAATFQEVIDEIAELDDPKTRELWADAVQTFASTGDTNSLNDVTRYRRKVVDIDEFLFGAAYLHLEVDEIYPGVYRAIRDLDTDQYDEVVMKGAIGIGKCQKLDTPIPTPLGWTTIGDLQDGDQVFDNYGEICNVVKAHPIRYGLKTYEVVFSDGEIVTVCAEHNWYTLTRNERRPFTRHGKKRNVQGSVRTTEQIKDTLVAEGKYLNHTIPLTQPVQYHTKDLAIDPYIFGMWLGDGSSRAPTLCTMDAELHNAWAEEANRRGLKIRKQDMQDNRAWTLHMAGTGIRGNSFINDLRKLDVWGNKHIPIDYLQGDVKQRIAVLQGLMDTDGYVSKQTNVCEFVSKWEHLSDNVIELLRSLGLKPTKHLKVVDDKPYWRVHFSAAACVGFKPFRLTRKIVGCQSAGEQAMRQRSRYIVDVREVASVPMRCLTVDSPMRLYLCGAGFIPTHNTSLANFSCARDIYKLSCMRSPHQVYGIAKGTPIDMTIQSVRLSTAKKVVFEELGRMIRGSAYFMQKFPFDKHITSEMIFREHNIRILPLSSNSSAAISRNVIGGQMDEMNFMSKIHKSKSSQADAQGSFDQAMTLYNNLASRRKSRFINRGDLPGALYLISSSRFPEDFTERKAAEATMRGGDDDRIYVFEGSQWEVKGRDDRSFFTEAEFSVQIGNETYPSKVLKTYTDTETGEDREELPNAGCEVIKVPMTFHKDFMRDTEGSLRDLAGVTTLATRPFIGQRDKITLANFNAKENGYFNPMYVEEAEFSIGIPDLDRKKLRLDVDMPRHAHIDLGIRKDACGIAVGHIAGHKVTEHQDASGKKNLEVLPIVAYDVILRVVPPLGGEIELEGIRKFLRKLNTKYGLNIETVTFDGFQCVAADTLVWTNRGMVRADSVIVGDIVQSRIGPRRVTKVWNFGKQKTLTIKTEDGHTITTTGKHKLEAAQRWTYPKGGARQIKIPTWGWTKTKDLRLGDVLHTWDGVTEVTGQNAIELVQVPRVKNERNRIYLPDVLDETFAKFLGVVWGDGSIGKRHVCITAEPGDRQDIERIIDDALGPCHVSVSSKENKSISMVVSSDRLINFLNANGLTKTYCDFPELIKSSNRYVQAAFLSGLFATDGSVKKRDGQPSYSTKSKVWAEYVQNFMRMAFGIQSCLTESKRDGDHYATDSEYQYIVSVRGSRKKFYDKIGFAFSRKNNELEKHLNVKGRDLWSKIVSITESEADVVDFEVEEDHAYLANGIVSHNSTDSRQLLAKMGFRTGYLSVEKAEPWRSFRDALYDERILLPGHNFLNRELAEVETSVHNNKEKIDHRPTGTKDVADAVVGVASYLLSRRVSWQSAEFVGGRTGNFLLGDPTRFHDNVSEIDAGYGAANRGLETQGPSLRKKLKRRRLARK